MLIERGEGWMFCSGVVVEWFCRRLTAFHAGPSARGDWTMETSVQIDFET